MSFDIDRCREQLRCAEMPPAIALCVADFAADAGPDRAARYLQTLTGSKLDGRIGEKTIDALRKLAAVNLGNLVKAYQQARRRYYEGLPGFDAGGDARLRKVDEIEAEALGLIR